ncbi:hypothetical protein HMPREF9374_3632 [Desmospora sp. 8437]|nr:hypothetical protein HMPREF9374_3632 [Desmospora sp. 8437]
MLGGGQVGIGFHIPFRCSSKPKSLHVKPNPSDGLFHKASGGYAGT